MKTINDGRIIKFAKFCLVGVFNTLITLCTIFICKSLIGLNEYVSNAIGYILGVVNSFLWNKQWVFHSHGRYRHEALKFAIGFGLSYTLQLLTVVALNTSDFGNLIIDTGIITVSGYGLATVIGCGVYTISNYAYNNIITFKNLSSHD